MTMSPSLPIQAAVVSGSPSTSSVRGAKRLRSSRTTMREMGGGWHSEKVTTTAWSDATTGTKYPSIGRTPSLAAARPGLMSSQRNRRSRHETWGRSSSIHHSRCPPVETATVV